jgi:hypothetical protein
MPTLALQTTAYQMGEAGRVPWGEGIWSWLQTFLACAATA